VDHVLLAAARRLQPAAYALVLLYSTALYAVTLVVATAFPQVVTPTARYAEVRLAVPGLALPSSAMLLGCVAVLALQGFASRARPATQAAVGTLAGLAGTALALALTAV
jgi:hypothetical protein